MQKIDDTGASTISMVSNRGSDGLVPAGPSAAGGSMALPSVKPDTPAHQRESLVQFIKVLEDMKGDHFSGMASSKKQAGELFSFSSIGFLEFL